MATTEQIQQCRWEVQDVEPGLYILDDATYDYLLTKNSDSIRKSSLDAARLILMRLALSSTDSTVDCISLKSSKQVDAYRQALLLYIKDPTLNSLHLSAGGWGGGISKADVEANNANPDNNLVPVTNDSVLVSTPQVNTDNYFSV